MNILKIIPRNGYVLLKVITSNSEGLIYGEITEMSSHWDEAKHLFKVSDKIVVREKDCERLYLDNKDLNSKCLVQQSNIIANFEA